MISALLVAALAQLPSPGPGPNAADPPSAVRLLFQAGDLRRAVGVCRNCAGAKKKHARECLALLKPLVEYQALISRAEALEPAQARALLEYEKRVSPEVPSRLSAPVVSRHVSLPWREAEAALAAGDETRARALAAGVLAVWPAHAGAQALLAVKSPDGGTPPRPRPAATDAGPRRPASDAGR